MSFPSEMIRTTANIAEQGVKANETLGKGAVRVKGSNLTPTVTEILEDGQSQLLETAHILMVVLQQVLLD